MASLGWRAQSRELQTSPGAKASHLLAGTALSPLPKGSPRPMRSALRLIGLPVVLAAGILTAEPVRAADAVGTAGNDAVGTTGGATSLGNNASNAGGDGGTSPTGGQGGPFGSKSTPGSASTSAAGGSAGGGGGGGGLSTGTATGGGGGSGGQWAARSNGLGYDFTPFSTYTGGTGGKGFGFGSLGLNNTPATGDWNGGGGGGGGDAFDWWTGSGTTGGTLEIKRRTLTGGAGGKGGDGSGTGNRGGDGGKGGIGIQNMKSGVTTMTIDGAVSGGAGGAGGANGGKGGDGGEGILVTSKTGQATLNITAAVKGGDAGAGGSNGGQAGQGGTGIVGSNMAVTVDAQGSVSGGMGGSGLTQQGKAIEFTSGENTLTVNGNGTVNGDIAVSSGSLAFSQGSGTAHTYANVISGAGAVQKTGDGKVVFAGANTYTGGTTVSAGILALTGVGTLGVSNGTTTITGGTLDLGGTTQTQQTLALRGGTLAGFLGKTDGSTGTLNVDTFQMTGGTVDANAIVNASTAFDLQAGLFDGKLMGSGALLKSGPGVVTLSGANGYTGGTQITGGTLVAGATNALGQGGNLAIGQAGTLDLAGFDETVNALLGFGTGATTYGTITNNGAPGSLARLNVGAGNGNSLFAGTITDGSNGGSVALTKTGTGRMTLGSAGTFTYSGATTVDGGTLIVDGNLAASDVTVNTSGTLTGTGSMKSATIKTGGTFVAGNGSPGSVTTVTGKLDFEAGSTFQVAVTPSGFSSVNAGSVVINGGTLKMTASPQVESQWSIGQTYNLLTTSSMTGSFSAITSDWYFIKPLLQYGPTGVTGVMTFNGNTFGGLAAGVEASSVGAALDKAGTQTDNPLIRRVYNVTTKANGNEVLRQLSGAQRRTAEARLSTTVSTQVLGAVDAALTGFAPSGAVTAPATLGYAGEAKAPAGPMAGVKGLDARTGTVPLLAQPQGRLWASALGAAMDMRANAATGAAEEHSTLGGLVAGIDNEVVPGLRGGLAVAGGKGRNRVSGAATTAEATFGQLAAYALATFGDGYAKGILSYGHQSTDTTRTLAAFANDRAISRFGSDVFSGRFEAGCRLGLGGIGATPYLAFEPTLVRQAARTETAVTAGGAPSPVGLSVPSTTLRSLPVTAGLRFDAATTIGEYAVTGSASLGWVHDLEGVRRVAQSFAALPGSVFLTRVSSPDSDLARLDLGLDVRPANGLTSFTLRGQGDLGRHTQAVRGSAGLTTRF